MANSILNLTPQQLRAAADLQERIESLQAALARLLGGRAQVAAAGAVSPALVQRGGKKKGKISNAGLERIRAAQRARWAKWRAANKK